MKVKELKKINEFAHENDFTLDYEKIVTFDAKDISRILKLIDKKSMNVEILIRFFEFEISVPNWKKKFEHIRGIEDFDIREYIIDKISNANSLALSKAIYDYFDGECADILILFKDVQEYQTYIESITANIEKKDYVTFQNIEFFLKKVPSNTDRNELIKNVMKYSQRKNQSLLFGTIEWSEFTSEDYLGILSLLIKNYNSNKVCTLFKKWHSDRYYREATEVNESYETVKEYLLKSKLFDSRKDNERLIKIFCETEYREYGQIVTLLNKVEESNDKELFAQCLKCGYQLYNENIRYYINEILKIGNSNSDLRQSILYLLKNEISVNNSAAAVVNILKKANEVDISSKKTAQFITTILNIDLIVDMPITSENYSTREVVYREFPKFISFRNKQIEIECYKSFLNRLCSLPADICKKVMDIHNLPVVKNMDIKSKNELKDLILNPENHGSLEYIYARYAEKEKEYELHELELARPVVELLTNKNTDKVLDGFDDDEEITPKTLIRSLAYKNNQNN